MHHDDFAEASTGNSNAEAVRVVKELGLLFLDKIEKNKVCFMALRDVNSASFYAASGPARKLPNCLLILREGLLVGRNNENRSGLVTFGVPEVGVVKKFPNARLGKLAFCSRGGVDRVQDRNLP